MKADAQKIRPIVHRCKFMQIHGLHQRFACRILSRMNRIQSELRRRRSPLP
jgi:hypothetical protein